jgi:2-phospho-L-lactate/phosphoenolpyruvate guanylyltransferase
MRMLSPMLAIVPVKGGSGAKSRLASLLTPAERAQLVEEMLDRVLVACREARSITRTLLVTPAPGAARADVDVLVDAGSGHADAVTLALADERSARGALVVMADCPLVTGEALDELAAEARPLALAPAADGGVNALALADPRAFTPVFGTSAAAMITAAHGAGLDPAVVRDARLELDIDRPEDLARV